MGPVSGPQLSGPQRILVLARSVSVLGDFAAPVALSFAVLALAPGPEAASRLALVPGARDPPRFGDAGMGADREREAGRDQRVA